MRLALDHNEFALKLLRFISNLKENVFFILFTPLFSPQATGQVLCETLSSGTHLHPASPTVPETSQNGKALEEAMKALSQALVTADLLTLERG